MKAAKKEIKAPRSNRPHILKQLQNRVAALEIALENFEEETGIPKRLKDKPAGKSTDLSFVYCPGCGDKLGDEDDDELHNTFWKGRVAVIDCDFDDRTEKYVVTRVTEETD